MKTKKEKELIFRKALTIAYMILGFFFAITSIYDLAFLGLCVVACALSLSYLLLTLDLANKGVFEKW